MTAAEIGSLVPRDRQRLMLEVVRVQGGERDWRALYGTSLGSDERFCATVRWARQRELEKLKSHLRELRKQITIGGKLGMTDIGRSISMPESSRALAKLADGHFKFGAAQIAMASLGDLYKPFEISALQEKIGLATGAGTLMGSMGRTRLADITSGMIGGSTLVSGGKLGMTDIGRSISMPESSRALAKLADGHFKFGAAQIAMASLGDLYKPFEISALQEKIGLATGAGTLMGKLGIDSGPGTLGFGRTGAFDALQGLVTLGGNFSELRRTMDGLLVVEYRRSWSSDPMWFLLNHLSPRDLPQLLLQSKDQIYKAVLDGLEEVVQKTPVITALRAAFESMPFLSEAQRAWLEHGLEHADNGEWLQASLPLFAGYEGGLHSSAVDMKAIPQGRRGKLPSAEVVIKAFDLEDPLKAFVRELVFGGRGNAFRHGRPEHEARDQVLLLIVGIIAWVDFVSGAHGIERLAQELHSPLRRAFGHRQVAGSLATA